jgi:DNA-directed RNA polymerase specialized sigma24 family protein
MHRSSRDEEFSAFVREHRTRFLLAARLLNSGDTHRAEDLVQTALARLYAAWPRMRSSPVAYVHRIMVNAHIDETRQPWWRRERSVAELPEPVLAAGAADDEEVGRCRPSTWSPTRVRSRRATS